MIFMTPQTHISNGKWWQLKISSNCLPRPFLLSEHTLCKESFVTVKKFDFETFTYLFVFRSPE